MVLYCDFRFLAFLGSLGFFIRLPGKNGFYSYLLSAAEVALDLAHRWQVNGVVDMLSSALQETISADSFVAIAEAAALKGIQPLGVLFTGSL